MHLHRFTTRMMNFYESHTYLFKTNLITRSRKTAHSPLSRPVSFVFLSHSRVMHGMIVHIGIFPFAVADDVRAST